MPMTKLSINIESRIAMIPILYIVIPCYNEEAVLPITSGMFLDKLNSLIERNLIMPSSRIMFVNDGSTDSTWSIISGLCDDDEHFCGLSLSRNFGHQYALLAGLMEAKELADITISIDCDGQDDINAMDDMVTAYQNGADIVYGVRSDRSTDSFFKRNTALLFYKLMNKMGSNTVYNHADYRLLDKRFLNELTNYKESNLFLRGLIPMVGFNSTCVYYERHARLAGKSHYPLRRMINFAIEGITSLSVKPIRLITILGCIVSLFGFAGVIWAIIMFIMSRTVAGWASMICIVCFLGGIQLLSLGVIGEYIGRIYLETKERPRYIIKEKKGSPYSE